MSTFKIPLKKETKDRPAPNITLDHAAIGKILHERISESWYPVTKDFPLVPCTYMGCTSKYDPNTKIWSPGCNYECQKDRGEFG